MVITVVGDYKVCLNEANAFLSVAKSCLGNNADFLSGKMYPFAVNISFSCELYLKAIMIHKSPTNQFCKGHDLKKLFEDLNNCEQNVIETIYKKRCNEPLRELLEKNSKAFEQWRYAFQDR